MKITVWPWLDAPEKYRQLSTNGGDEDWVAICDEWLGPDERWGFLPRANEIDAYSVADNKTFVYIGCHS